METGQPATGIARRGIRPVGIWYFVVVIGTAGLFAWVPYLHAARRLKTSTARWLAATYGGVDAVMYVLLSITPQDTTSGWGDAVSTIAGLLIFGIVITACIPLWSLRRKVDATITAETRADSPTLDPAVQAVLAARARRDEARRLAADDPLLARELHIGRPDTNRHYDDGGLVDLNSAPAHTIAEICGIPPDVAATIVAARTQRGEPFSNVDELFVLADLPVTAWDRIRDRAVLLT